MNKVNFQKKLDEYIESIKDADPPQKLLLHSCCAPCSSYVIEYLSSYLKIMVFYYNPNIFPREEYYFRKAEQKRLINEMKTKYPVDFADCDYENTAFEEISKGLEDEKEGGKRCTECFKLRLDKTASKAKELGIDTFATTLTVSPMKNAVIINEIGSAAGKKHGVFYLESDFKKKEGYKRSIELSKQFDLYRQQYCGCYYSQRELQGRE